MGGVVGIGTFLLVLSRKDSEGHGSSQSTSSRVLTQPAGTAWRWGEVRRRTSHIPGLIQDCADMPSHECDDGLERPQFHGESSPYSRGRCVHDSTREQKWQSRCVIGAPRRLCERPITTHRQLCNGKVGRHPKVRKRRITVRVEQTEWMGVLVERLFGRSPSSARSTSGLDPNAIT